MRYQKQVRVPNSLGLHVRPATQLAQVARKFESTSIKIIKDSVDVDAKSAIALLTLAAVQGTLLTVVAEGEQAQQAVEEICSLIHSGFGEA